MSVWKYQPREWPKDPLDFPPGEMVPDSVMVILTGIIRNGEFNYYVLPAQLLYLDGRKASEDCAGGAFYAGIEGRYGIMTVDEAHEDEFFRAIEPHERSCERLLEEVHMCLNRYERMDYYADVLIDFDRKHLVSHYQEPFFFEKYVPDGWTSEFREIVDDDFPEDKRFWIDDNGEDIFMLLYEEDIRSGREKPYVPPVPLKQNKAKEKENDT